MIKRSSYRTIALLAALLLQGFLLCGCSTMPFVHVNKAYTRIFLTDYSTAWTAALDAVSAGRDIIKAPNRDQGTIETDWIEFTEQKHFLEAFTDEDFFLRARYRLKLQLRAGKKNGESAVIVQVMREEQVERTFLAGWEINQHPEHTIEATVLYRVGRLIAIQEQNEKLAAQAADKNDSDMVEM